MDMRRVLTQVLTIAAAVGYLTAAPAQAVSVIANGGFEAGLTGWTRVDQVGSDGTFSPQTGTASPVNSDPVPAPPQGAFAAMSDAQGPGSHVLYQNFTIPAAVPSATLSFDLFVGNRAAFFATPNTLDFSTPELNQHARVDILKASADPFSLAAGDVLQPFFRTEVGSPLVSGYTHFSFDATALVNGNLGVPLRLRFAETDNLFTFQLGVDNVALEVGAAQAVPEPATWVLMLTGGLGIAWHRRRHAA